MAFTNGFYDYAVSLAGGNALQKKLIDSITNSAPALKAMPFETATHAFHHVFQRLIDAEGADTVDLDGELPDIGSTIQAEKIDLAKVGGKFVFGADIAAAFGGSESYVNKKLPPAINKSGMSVERNFYTGTFLPKSIQFEKAISTQNNPDTSGSYGTMVAVTWMPGEIAGILSPVNEGGDLFYIKKLCNGETFLYNGIESYGLVVKSFLGLLVENPNYISSLVNIGTDVPSITQLTELVDRANGGDNTVIYTSRQLASRIAAHYSTHDTKSDLISVTNGQVSIMGVPVVKSSNFPETVSFINAPFIA